MVVKLIYMSLILIGASVGYNLFPNILVQLFPSIPALHSPIISSILGSVLGLFISVFLAEPIERQIVRIKEKISEVNASYLLFGTGGAFVGLVIGGLINLLLMAFHLPIISDVLPIILTIILAYSGFEFASTRREEIRRIFLPRSEGKIDDSGVLMRKEGDNFRRYKVLDTSVIIDGRILDIVQTGFLEGTLVVSMHVLRELQHIADSSDSLKRVRGRRGLDILNALQKQKNTDVQMDDSELEEAEEVDMKLVVLARKMDGVVVTNDYNLNKVAEIQNVPVLNVNELANSVKPVVIPGEQMSITIVKQGTERNQGVGYLDDGTMVVVEEGKFHINETLDVIVTSSLQTNAGRMIFAKIANDHRQIEKSDD